MKRLRQIGFLLLLGALLASCHSPQREARRMVRRAERLFDTKPDSTFKLIDSILRMPVYFNEKHRMDMALLQGEALFGDRGQEIPPLMDDEFFDDKPFLTASPELERAADYYAKKKQYAKAAHAALYSGFVQQHYNDKAAAMQSFKDAEHYGKMVKDSLTVARAEYWMGRLLLDDGLRENALAMLKNADNGSNHLVEKALVQNTTSVCYMLQGEYDNAENCLKQSILYLGKGDALNVRNKVLNNYAVLYRLQGNYTQSIDCLRQTINQYNLDEAQTFVYYLNMAKTFMAIGIGDSAMVYYQRVENLLPAIHLKSETKLSAYNALSRFAEIRNNYPLALGYRQIIEELMSKLMYQRQNQSVYRIQKQYDYENMQNTLNRKILLRHKIILIISILLFAAAVVILILQFRYKQMREAETEMKKQIAAMKEDLQQTVKSSVMDEEMASRLRMILAAKRAAKRAKDFQNEWGDLVNRVMNGKGTMFDAARATIERVYPNLYSVLMEKYPSLTETEAKICVLSFCDISNTEIGDLLGLRPTTINQHRSSLRKKLNLKSDKMKEQLRNVISQDT